MEIVFGVKDQISQNQGIGYERQTIEYGRTNSSKNIDGSSFRLDISGTVTDNNAYAGHGRTAEDVMNAAAAQDVALTRKQLTVMSNFLSDEDLTKAMRDGYNPADMDPKDTVTILDKIKLTLMKSGVEVSGYTDTLSDDMLTELTGSASFANNLKEEFRRNDIPLTKENVVHTVEAYKQLSGISELTDGTMKYMVENHSAPTSENLYLASFSGSGDASSQGRGYFEQEQGSSYYAKKADDIHFETISSQIDQIIEKAGLPISDKNREYASWLVEKGVPLTTENLNHYHMLAELQLPLSQEDFVKSAAAAISEGTDPKRASLAEKENIYSKALSIEKEYLENPTARRLLEEARVSMSAQANLHLLKTGFRIDLAPMEEVIKALREVEKEMAIELTEEENPTEAIAKDNQYNTTLFYLEAIKSAPISIVASTQQTDSLESVYEKSQTLLHQRAEERYEQFMSTPRSDLGDSIKEAFRNSKELLEEIDLPFSEENQRAVRILGYNQMEISRENIFDIKEKDKLLRDVIDRLSPAKVLAMIREGINPTKESLSDLKAYLNESPEGEKELSSYSKFLYQLEQNKEITQEERSAYIGIYRLISQIEKGDMAALGSVDYFGADITLENLLTAERSRKHRRMDYTVDDNFGGISKADTAVESITSQIQKGFMGDVMDLKEVLREMEDPKESENYNKELFEEYRQGLHSEESVILQLQNYEEPITVNNLQAMDAMLNASDRSYKKIKEQLKEKVDLQKDGEVVIKKLTDKESAEKSYSEFVENLQKTILEDGLSKEEHFEEIKWAANIYKQLSFFHKMAKEENYEIPVEINGEITNINLKILHKKESISKVAISLENDDYGFLCATYEMGKTGLCGNLNATNKEGIDSLRKHKDLLETRLKDVSINPGEMYFNHTSYKDLKTYASKLTDHRESSRVSSEELYKAAKAFIGFLQEVSQINA